ncbi:MAG TPA: PD-(D/E)XK nuclease family protein [Actinomycetota bacterium]|nr:PD-(D/E)XK nuclease family protein [Actinomycetota bacterium]
MTLDRLFDEGQGLFELNPSKVQCYLDCPRQYRFRYVERRPERRTFGPTALGRSVHKALRDFYGLESSERTVDNLLRALRRAWDGTGYRSSKDAEDAFARAEDMLRRYHAGTDPQRARVVALESKFSHAKSGEGILVTGRVDRIDIDEGDYVIVDYKTGRFGQTDESIDESLPLSLYAIAVSAVLGRPVNRVAVEHLPTGRRAETNRDDGRISGDWKALVDLADEMRSIESEFPPKPGPLCPWCDYLTICPEGRASMRVSNAAADEAPPLVDEYS